MTQRGDPSSYRQGGFRSAGPHSGLHPGELLTSARDLVGLRVAEWAPPPAPSLSCPSLSLVPLSFPTQTREYQLIKWCYCTSQLGSTCSTFFFFFFWIVGIFSLFLDQLKHGDCLHSHVRHKCLQAVSFPKANYPVPSQQFRTSSGRGTQRSASSFLKGLLKVW